MASSRLAAVLRGVAVLSVIVGLSAWEGIRREWRMKRLRLASVLSAMAALGAFAYWIPYAIFGAIPVFLIAVGWLSRSGFRHP